MNHDMRDDNMDREFPDETVREPDLRSEEPMDAASDPLSESDGSGTAAESEERVSENDPVPKDDLAQRILKRMEADEQEQEEHSPSESKLKSVFKRQVSKKTVWWVLITELLLVVSIFTTYWLTYFSVQKQFRETLFSGEHSAAQISASERLALLMSKVREKSYYANSMNEEEMLRAAFDAYVRASGDRYAEYYTAEQYQQIQQANAGNRYYGIGVTVQQTEITVKDTVYKAFQIQKIHVNSSATLKGIRIGDYIVGVDTSSSEGSTPQMKLVNELGYEDAMQIIRGELGTSAGIYVYREGSDELPHEPIELERGTFETVSVSRISIDEWAKPSVGILRIEQFDLTTPEQFKRCMNELLQDTGITEIIFDVRDNPGGDLQSIKAVMSYFLHEGDLILKSIDKDGAVGMECTVQVQHLNGNYAGCSVTSEEIGMYSDLGKKLMVLCNENTASAAEVFTATMRDYGLATIAGQKTFGKGIMQTTEPMMIGSTLAFIKLTTHAYVTKCGVTYHEIGIEPTEGYVIPDSDAKVIKGTANDSQLKNAVFMMANGQIETP